MMGIMPPSSIFLITLGIDEEAWVEPKKT